MSHSLGLASGPPRVPPAFHVRRNGTNSCAFRAQGPHAGAVSTVTHVQSSQHRTSLDVGRAGEPLALGLSARPGTLTSGRRRVVAQASLQPAGDLPKDWTQVVSWAREAFRRCVVPSLADRHVPLGRACMLVALEEEAARQGDSLHPELRDLVMAMTQLKPRSAASASTWSLERLDALAAEVAALLDRQLAEQQQQQPTAGQQQQQAVDPHISGEQQQQQQAGGEQQEQQQQGGGQQQEGEEEQQQPLPQQRHQQQQGQEEGSGSGGLTSSGQGKEGEAGQGERRGLGQVAEPHTPGRPEGAAPAVAQQQDQGSGGERAQSSNSDSSSSSNSSSSSSSGSTEAPLPSQVQLSSSFDFEEEQEQLLERIASSQPGAVGSSRGRGRGGGSSGDEEGAGAGQPQQYYGAAWPTDTGPGWAGVGPRRRADLYRRYPVQTLTAVNTVLFDRHGYQPCNRYGVPSDHQLAAVLEGGVGASAALSILYLEVCERLGFPLAARPLEDGRYFVLWPMDAPLAADGQRFLVDPYGRGGLLLLEEVCEIFGVSPEQLQPASRRELLAALLGELRDAHWAAAAGCSASPAAMVPLVVDTALANKVQVPATGVRAAALRRALAACEKRLWLLPNDSEAQLQYGLLLYFCRKYDDAWIELALYLERYGPKASANGQPGKREGGAGRGGMLGREHEQGEQGSAQSAFADYSATESDAVVGREAQAGPEVAGRAGGSGSMEDVAAQSADHGGQSNGSTVPSEQAARVQMLIEKLRLLLDFAPASVNN